MIKPALIAFALTAIVPAHADTIQIDLLVNPFYPPDGLAVAFLEEPYDPVHNLVFVVETPDINISIGSYIITGVTDLSAAVPEPSTWALMLFGFAFFAIKGIWPGASHG